VNERGALARAARLGVEPPPPGAGHTAGLKFVRDLSLRTLLPGIAVAVLVILLVDATWATVLVAALLLLQILDIAYLTYAVRRDSAQAS
jgi:hypothetical protein